MLLQASSVNSYYKKSSTITDFLLFVTEQLTVTFVNALSVSLWKTDFTGEKLHIYDSSISVKWKLTWPIIVSMSFFPVLSNLPVLV